MKTSETITKIIPALLKTQKEIEPVLKSAENPFYKSKFADLPSLMFACKEKLNNNGILVLQPVVGDFVETILIHESGEFVSSKMRIINAKQNDPQSQGSAVSYARRYGLQSMLFMSAEDDDGEKATDHKITSLSPLKQTIPVKSTTDTSLGKCVKCGADMKLSMQGKKYCSAKCWLGTIIPDKVEENFNPLSGNEQDIF